MAGSGSVCRARRAYPQGLRRDVSCSGRFRVFFTSTSSEDGGEAAANHSGRRFFRLWSGSSLRTRVENLTEACSLGESCLSSHRGGDSLCHKPEDRAKAGGNGGGPADRSASHDSLWKEGGVI